MALHPSPFEPFERTSIRRVNVALDSAVLLGKGGMERRFSRPFSWPFFSLRMSLYEKSY